MNDDDDDEGHAFGWFIYGVYEEKYEAKNENMKYVWYVWWSI